MLSKNVNNKKCAPKLIFFNEKKIEKDSDNIWYRKLTLKVGRLGDFALFDTSPLVQFTKFKNFLWVCWFSCKNLSNCVSLPWKFHNPYRQAAGSNAAWLHRRRRLLFCQKVGGQLPTPASPSLTPLSSEIKGRTSSLTPISWISCRFRTSMIKGCWVQGLVSISNNLSSCRYHFPDLFAICTVLFQPLSWQTKNMRHISNRDFKMQKFRILE